MRAIIALGVLAGIAVLLQLANASPKIFPFTNLVIIGAPPGAIRMLEHLGIIGVVIFYGVYLGFLTLWLTLKSFVPKLEGFLWHAARAFFGLGTAAFILGIIAFVIRLFY